MLEACPGAIINIGNGNTIGSCPVHNPHYDFNELHCLSELAYSRAWWRRSWRDFRLPEPPSMREETVTALPTVEKKKRGKKPKAAGHIKVYKTAIFKIHNPSQHKRAMLKYSLKRAHLAYTRLLAYLIPDIERFAAKVVLSVPL
jgi:hypothetical protein